MLQTALFPRGWHVVAWRRDGRVEHYTPEVVASYLHLNIRASHAWDAQTLADQIAMRLGVGRVESYYDGRLMARSSPGEARAF